MLGQIGHGQILLAERAYDSNALREQIDSQGGWACIKPLAHRKYKPAFSAFLYRYRSRVECFFSKIKHFRAIATRFEKHAENYLALVKLAAIQIWIRNYESVS